MKSRYPRPRRAPVTLGDARPAVGWAGAFLESYGSPEVRALTQASRATLEAADLLTPRPMLWLAPEGATAKLRALLAAERALSGVEAGAQDLDVAGLPEYYRRMAVTGGATVHTGSVPSGG